MDNFVAYEAEDYGLGLSQGPEYAKESAERERNYRDTVNSPEYKAVDKEDGFMGDPYGQASDYKVPLGEWLGKTPEERKKYRDEEWKKDPFNIHGDAWSWAPWNQGKKPQTSKDQDPDANGDVPIINAPSNPIYFQVTRKAFDRYFKEANGRLTYQDTSALYSFSAYGIPVGLKYQKIGFATHVSIGIKQSTTGITVYTPIDSYVLAGAAPSGSGLAKTAPKVSISPAAGGLAQSTSDVDIPASEQLPQPQLEPLAPPQYQPTGYPELPIPAVPYPSPKPFPNLRPSPAPNLRPSPYRDPKTQPTPFPKPTVDPTAPPTTQPNTEPSPFPSIQPNPNPGPQVRPQPQPSFAPSGSPSRSPNATPDNLKVPNILTERQPQINIDINLPAPDVDLCKDPCIADMHETSESQKPVPIQYQVFVECNIQTGDPVFRTESIEVPANQADFMQTMLNQVAQLQGEKCLIQPQECYAAMPDSHEIRLVGIPPQLVIQYAEQLQNGKFGAPKYSISIPYYRYSEADTTAKRFPVYTKGQRFGVLVLPDNAKLTINAISEAEVNRVLKQLELLISPDKKQGAITSNNARRGQNLKQIKVAPRIAKYFGGGKNAKPEWIKYF